MLALTQIIIAQDDDLHVRWAVPRLFTLSDGPSKKFMHFLCKVTRPWSACYIWIVGDPVDRDPGVNDRSRKSPRMNTLGGALRLIINVRWAVPTLRLIINVRWAVPTLGINLL